MRGLRRTKAVGILTVGCLILVLLTSAALAQDAGTRALTPGSTVSGTLDGDNLGSLSAGGCRRVSVCACQQPQFFLLLARARMRDISCG